MLLSQGLRIKSPARRPGSEKRGQASIQGGSSGGYEGGCRDRAFVTGRITDPALASSSPDVCHMKAVTPKSRNQLDLGRTSSQGESGADNDTTTHWCGSQFDIVTQEFAGGFAITNGRDRQIETSSMESMRASSADMISYSMT